MAKNSVQTVGKKWFFGLMIFLWGCIVLCGYIVFSIVNINKFNELSNQIDDILICSQKSSGAAKEFLMNAYIDENFVKTGTNESFEAFNKSMDSVLLLTQSFQKSSYIDSEDKKQAMANLDSDLNTYKYGFYMIAELFKQKGFKDLGLEGEMRKAIHFIENHEAPIDLEFLLMLRRHEKDFLLRKDTSYVAKFNADIFKFEAHIKSNTKIYPEYHRKDILAALEDYKADFNKIVGIEVQIGLHNNEGHRLELLQSLASAERTLAALNTDIKEQKREASYAVNIIIGSIIVVFILIIAVVFFSINYLNSAIIHPIQQLNAAADQIANGNLSVDLNGIKNKRLMQELVLSYEKLVEKLKATIAHIELITARKIASVFELNNQNDEIGRSLNRIITELQHLDNEDRKRVWITEGLAQFGYIIRTNNSLAQLCNDVIVFLVKYLNANQGGVFVVKVDAGNETLELMASYAYDRKKYFVKTIEKGEGLVGQCYIDKDLIMMTDIPDEYMRITSGLGNSNPKALLVAPMIGNQNVEAVIELATFGTFEEYHIEFIKKIGEIMASTISNVKTNQMTSQLLTESKMQSEQMRSQEEEMRQNMEEMKATQEEIERKENDYKHRITVLETENEKLKTQINTQSGLQFSMQ